MNENIKPPKIEEQQNFWEAYRACTEQNRVRPDLSSFYVKWAQAFASFLPEKRLQERSGKDVQAFWLSWPNVGVLLTGRSGKRNMP